MRIYTLGVGFVDQKLMARYIWSVLTINDKYDGSRAIKHYNLQSNYTTFDNNTVPSDLYHVRIFFMKKTSYIKTINFLMSRNTSVPQQVSWWATKLCS